MTILCGTDLSAASGPALAAAEAFARRLGETDLLLAHALDEDAPPPHTAAGRALHDQALQRLEAIEARRLRASLPLAIVRCAVLPGPASRTLLGLAEREGAALVVVASQGHGASSLLRLGGTSERLAQATCTPLLVVRDPAPFAAWAEGERPLRVLLGADGSASCEAAIRWVKALRGPSIQVIVGHVYYPDVERERYGLPPARSVTEPDREVERLLIRDLAAAVGDLGPDVRIRPVLGLGRAGDHLLRLAEAEGADLVVLGTHRQRGLARLASLGSVVLHHGRASVLIAPQAHEDLLPPLADLQPIERVLIATDLSAFSNHAIPLGYSLLPRGGQVHLLHVLPARGAEGDVQHIRARLHDLVPTSARAAGVTSTLEVVHNDDPAQAIVEAAERLGANLVCVAAHGRTWLERAVVGSVTRAVLQRCLRPVVVLRPPGR